MKIGIITFNRIYNYGSRLQTYALNRFLTSEGYDVKTIDYAQPEQEKKRNKFYESPKGLMSMVRNFQVFCCKKSILESRKKFDSFTLKNIPSSQTYSSISELKKTNGEFDRIICGSDQIWNPTYFGFDSAYMLSFVKDKSKCISYAASIGVSEITHEDEKIFAENLRDFKHLSVREERGAAIVEECIGRKPDVVLDPVFLLDDTEWNNVTSGSIFKKPYILCYFIGNIDGMRVKAAELSKKVGLPLVVIRINLRDWLGKYKRHYSAGPEEFLGLIKNAEYVFTNSFHAVAFSLIFHKNFWVFSQDETQSSQSRIETLLRKTELQNRKVYADSCNIDWTESINFEGVDKKLKDEISASKCALSEYVK